MPMSSPYAYASLDEPCGSTVTASESKSFGVLDVGASAVARGSLAAEATATSYRSGPDYPAWAAINEVFCPGTAITCAE